MHNKAGLTVFLVAILVGLQGANAESRPFVALRIAHAGGGINGDTYTNSYDALDYNLERGFRYFEIDFSFTKDERLVCMHDWGISFKQTFGFEPKEEPTLETFMYLVRNAAKYKNCTIDGLAGWMAAHPEAVLITDVKDNNIKALRVIAGTIPDSRRRVIPQIYDPDNYNAVKKMGYESIIWTLYRHPMSNEEILKRVKAMDGPFAVTMPVDIAVKGLPGLLAKRNILTYTHTINDKQQLTRLVNQFKVTEIYTDFLNP